MVTFTLPYELRALTKANQKQLYSLLFECAVSTLKDFGCNDKAFAAEMAMMAVLHTHTRRLDYHPHVHVVVAGGGIGKDPHGSIKTWKKIDGKYLFNGYALAAVFKGKLLHGIEQAGLALPLTPKKWVVHCQHVGSGLPALKYLSRYLYRGVISNRNIVSDDGETVSFRYKDSKTGSTKIRRLPGEDFIRLILQHTLPKGFRRSRDYGFLHGNAKRVLQAVQWALRAVIPRPTEKPRPASSVKNVLHRC
ncbi:MAG: transposase [Proteobacteria bacterium]|nr:transposase [Pseudomonadota bacterium]